MISYQRASVSFCTSQIIRRALTTPGTPTGSFCCARGEWTGVGSTSDNGTIAALILSRGVMMGLMESETLDVLLSKDARLLSMDVRLSVVLILRSRGGGGIAPVAAAAAAASAARLATVSGDGEGSDGSGLADKEVPLDVCFLVFSSAISFCFTAQLILLALRNAGVTRALSGIRKLEGTLMLSRLPGIVPADEVGPVPADALSAAGTGVMVPLLLGSSDNSNLAAREADNVCALLSDCVCGRG